MSGENAVTAPVEDEGVNWSELDGDSDWGGESETAPLTAGESEPTAPVTPSPQEPQPVASPEQPQTPTPQQPVQTTPVEPPVPQQTNEERLAQYTQQLQEAYSLTADDATALLTQPEAVLPKLAAQVHMNVMREMQTQMQQLAQAMPALMQAEADRIQREESAKSEMYGTWPGLREHHSVVVKNANMIRQSNPQISKQQLIEMTGMMTAVALGLDPQTLKVNGSAPRQAPVRQQPMRPVNVAGSPSGLQPPPENIFSAFAEEDSDWMR